MYATDGFVAKSHASAHVDLSDIVKIWPNYFPEIELSVDDHRLKLAIDLAHFFSTPVGENLVSQLICGCKLISVPPISYSVSKDLRCGSRLYSCGGMHFFLMLVFNYEDFFLVVKGVHHLKAILYFQVKDENGLFLLPIDLEQLKKTCQVDEFYAKLETEPRVALLCMGAAVHKVLLSKWLNFPLEEDIKINIRLQELLRSENHEEGRVPRTVECELFEDLIDACIPGNVVTVTGIVKVINNYLDVGGGS
ncbi:hypothetical protein Scep_004752 [Stephania cephalantha]|uniref:MCM OB domain-containing protein n=1 Tax=Stephania cephalantha TaxID=152367 RepID=A0AAP0KUF3_9MAGN